MTHIHTPIALLYSDTLNKVFVTSSNVWTSLSDGVNLLLEFKFLF